jgi:catechol 2,3-dioxygenase-like lactoylglutathione lyase family enzyme
MSQNTPACHSNNALNFNHIGLSVANLTTQTHFYQSILGFNDILRNFTIETVPLFQVVQLQNPQGVIIELVSNPESTRAEVPKDPMDGSRLQGYFHWALSVGNLDEVYNYIVDAGTGARAISHPEADAFGSGRFAYVSDPEGNLIELLGP